MADCPVCQSTITPGTAICAHCGHDLQSTVPTSVFPIIKNRKFFELPQVQKSLYFPAGKAVLVLGREDPVTGIFPEIDLEPYGAQETGVSRRHAQVILHSGQAFIEDLDSINGTLINGSRLLPGETQLLEDGDEILLGKLTLVYHSG